MEGFLGYVLMKTNYIKKLRIYAIFILPLDALTPEWIWIAVKCLMSDDLRIYLSPPLLTSNIYLVR